MARSGGPEQRGRLVAALEGKADESQWLDVLLEHKSLADGLPGWSWGLSSLGQSSTNDGGRWSILRWLSLTWTHGRHWRGRAHGRIRRH